jgi:hypothetical protein
VAAHAGLATDGFTCSHMDQQFGYKHIAATKDKEAMGVMCWGSDAGVQKCMRQLAVHRPPGCVTPLLLLLLLVLMSYLGNAPTCQSQHQKLLNMRLPKTHWKSRPQTDSTSR